MVGAQVGFPKDLGSEHSFRSSFRLPLALPDFLPLKLHREFILKVGQAGVTPVVPVCVMMGLAEDTGCLSPLTHSGVYKAN